MKRRDYIIISGGLSLPLLSNMKNKSYAKIKQLNIKGSDSLDKRQIEYLHLNISEFILETNKLDENKPFTIIIESKYSEDKNYDELTNIDKIIDNKMVDIPPINIFNNSSLNSEKLINNDTTNLDIRVTVKHPDISKVRKTTTVQLSAIEYSGSLKDTNFGEGYKTRELRNKFKENTNELMDVWNKPEEYKLINLVSSKKYVDKSSKTQPKGIIDWSVNKFSVNPRQQKAVKSLSPIPSKYK